MTEAYRYFETARRIGAELVRDSIFSGRRCNWVGNWPETANGKIENVSRSFGPDLYGGTGGIALFLAALHQEEPDRLLQRTIEGAIEQCLAADPSSTPRHGFYLGRPGVAFALMKVGSIMQRKDWITAGLNMLHRLDMSVDAGFEWDLLLGAAGTIPALLYGHSLSGEESFLIQAIHLGELICSNTARSDRGSFWTTIPQKPPQTGLSHGSAGICLALLELYHACRIERFYDTAMDSIRFEQSLFNQTLCNWPDFREHLPANPSDYKYGHSWCNGAPGISLSRRRAAIITGQPEIGHQGQLGLLTTFRITLQQLSGAPDNINFSLCHGIAGNADILLNSGLSANVSISKTVGDLGIELFHSSKLPWASGLSNRRKTPGLMMGLAGTGYFYLRLYNPDKFPTILLPAIKAA